MEMYFGTLWSSLSTFALIITVGYIGFCMYRRKKIKTWGKCLLVLLMLGLVLCCFVVMRDEYVGALQGGIGIFALDSIQIKVSYVLAMCIGILAVSIMFLRKQTQRKYMFYTLAGCILCKIIWIEAARLLS